MNTTDKLLWFGSRPVRLVEAHGTRNSSMLVVELQPITVGDAPILLREAEFNESVTSEPVELSE